MAMDWIPVSSSAISRIAYYNGSIYIDWKEAGGSDIYAYSAPESVFHQLQQARSMGAFANQVVKQYPARHVS